MHIKSVFIKYYADLTKVLFISELSPEFVSAGIISFHEEEMIRSAPTSMEKAMKFSQIILSHIDINHTDSFVGMLDIMERKGKIAVADLARKIKSEICQTQPNPVKQDLFSFSDEKQEQHQQQLQNIPTNDIMSLYNMPAQSQYSSYTASPLNTLNYQQQQQEAPVKMAQQFQQHLMEVPAMQAQMANLNIQKGQLMIKMNDGVPLEFQPHHTMPPSQIPNPDPWCNFDASNVDYKENN